MNRKNAEDWLNENCEASDFSEAANQANDYIHTSNVIMYMDQYFKYRAATLLEEFWNRSSDACPLEADSSDLEIIEFSEYVRRIR